MAKHRTLNSIIDCALESSIVGSFTNIGFAARRRLHDLDPITTDLTAQLAVVTGATSGIGRATALGLMRLGADVVVTSRSQARATSVAAELADETDNGSAVGYELDTSEFDSIGAFVERLAALDRPIDMLLHNAGALSNEYRTNAAGTEATVASHLIGPYLLTKLVRSTLSDGARIVWMSSGGMYTQKLDVDAIEVSDREYRGAVAYARAKRAQVELTTHLGPLWAPGVVMHAMHPGWVDTPGVDAGLPGFGRVMGPVLRSPEQGADTMIWLAATGGDGEAGQFWLDRAPRGTSYLPGTSTTTTERKRLVDWLDAATSEA